jgi:tRNA threonylcarbamoyl adenosine modification protein YeaZ
MPATVLALDTASRQVSVAVATADAVLATRAGAQRGSSGLLVDWIDQCLVEAGVRLDQLAGAVALRGPGSFTGLRVGLATLLGIQQGIGLAATAVPTLGVLAAAVAARDVRSALALVAAGSGAWYAQAWDATWPPTPREEPRRLADAELTAVVADVAVVSSEDEATSVPSLAMPLRVAGALAPVAARLAAMHPPAWDTALLQSPLYLAPPPVTLPGPPKRILPATGEAR